MKIEKGNWEIEIMESTGQLIIRNTIIKNNGISCCNSWEGGNLKEVDDLIDLLKMWKLQRKNNCKEYP